MDKIDGLNCWLAMAKFKVINGSKWENIGSCQDTPIHVKEKLTELNKAGYRNIWIFDISGHKPAF